MHATVVMCPTLGLGCDMIVIMCLTPELGCDNFISISTDRFSFQIVLRI